MKKISEFVATLSEWPLQDSNRYEVNIMGPVGEFFPSAMGHAFTCVGCSIPGRAFDTTEWFTYGPIRKIPYMEVWDNMTTRFLMTEEMSDYQYFYDWGELIGNSSGTFDIGYYNDIVGNVKIKPIGRDGVNWKEITLYEAYPASLSEVELSYENKDQFAQFSVQWAYHHMEMK